MEKQLDKIILDICSLAKVSIPAEELWIFQNQNAKVSLARGLTQKAEHDLGLFANFTEDLSNTFVKENTKK